MPMLFRFSLYGFLKNQQYYEPFLILAFREKGMSFFQIGILIAFREICINIFEVPSGAIADVWGRRRAMVLSFGAYIISFIVFGLGQAYWQFFPAMFFFAIGEAFRTGTHKAMIFDWLSREGRADEKTKVYGFTRSWSQMGSAVSVVIAAVLVFVSKSYVYIFYLCIIPYTLNIINFLGYPKVLDGTSGKHVSIGGMFGLLRGALRQILTKANLRGLVVESMLFAGTFKAAKDYVQPILKHTALALPVLTAIAVERRTAVLVGIVFFILYLLSSAASRHTHVIVDKAGGEDRAAQWMWLAGIGGYAVLGVLLWFGLVGVALILYVGVYVLQNFWRPTQVSRFNVHAESESMATVLSMESQAKTFATMIIAPCLGKAVDLWGFWPIGVFGCVASVGGYLVSRTSSVSSNGSPETEKEKT
ncbi:MAG: MFS transporter [Planctomycetes bacterium]|nr:MFS transporter [Planctomycetota bacterium]